MSPETEAPLTIQQNEIHYPWLLFQLGKNYFAINSQRVAGIMICPENMTSLPDSPDFVRGLIMHHGNIIRLLDLRMLFGLETIEMEREDFHQMLEARKQDHLNWVEELERCIDTGDSFSLATDPHKCAFGKWYDNFESESQSVNHHLRKITDPHRKLHEAALAVAECRQDCENCKRSKCLKEILRELNEVLVPQIVSLLDEAQDVFRASYREMAILIEEDGRHLGLIVDQVLSVEDLNRQDLDDSGVNFFHDLTYIDGVCQSHTIEGNILVVNDAKLLELTGGDEPVMM